GSRTGTWNDGRGASRPSKCARRGQRLPLTAARASGGYTAARGGRTSAPEAHAETSPEPWWVALHRGRASGRSHRAPVQPFIVVRQREPRVSTPRPRTASA